MQLDRLFMALLLKLKLDHSIPITIRITIPMQMEWLIVKSIASPMVKEKGKIC